MAYLLIFLGAAALVAALVLLLVDGNRRDTSRREAPRREAEPRRAGLSLPGSVRRGRREWANKHGFDFAKRDDYLNGEWSRGAAAGGAPPVNVASGTSYGHDTFVVDMGGVTVMAMRTGEVSDVVVDLRREGFQADSSEDLLEVGEAEGFRIFATEAGPARRFLDVRVTTALELLPAAVGAVWCESEWVLAQTPQDADPATWDDVLAPLALLADAARVLPPRDWEEVIAPYPTREMAQPTLSEGSSAAGVGQAPPVQRPEEPLALPTRTTGAVRGVMDHRAVGGDEVEAIADGAERGERGPDLTRVKRDQAPPSIFGD